MRTYEWDAPAKLFFWPAPVEGSDEEAVYPTLGDAVTAAAEGDAASAWIVTHRGDLIPPRAIEALREDMASLRRRPSTVKSLFTWKRAA